jgi:acyl carrier protein
MRDEAIWARVTALVSEYSGSPATALDAASSPQNTAGWDSVANLGLIAAIEEEYDVTISTRDAIGLRTLGDIARYLEGRNATRSAG